MTSISATTLRKVARRLGVAILIGGACLYLHALWSETHTPWEALTLPLSLTPGAIRTPEFMTDLDEQYEVRLEFDNAPGVEKVDCYPLAPKSMLEACEQQAPLIAISWRLFDGEKVLAQGNSASRDILYGTPIQWSMGRFKAQKQKTYVIILEVMKDASILRQTRPRLVVGVPMAAREGIALGFAVHEGEGSALVVLGLAFFAVPWLVQRRKANGEAGNRQRGAV